VYVRACERAKFACMSERVLLPVITVFFKYMYHVCFFLSHSLSFFRFFITDLFGVIIADVKAVISEALKITNGSTTSEREHVLYARVECGKTQ
jgi:hypothetical protein